MQLTILPLLFALGTLAGDDIQWPGFLGAHAKGVQSQKLPMTWAPDSHVAWKTALVGHGQSSPVVYGSKVFVTTVDGPKKDDFRLICLDLKSGEMIWDAVTKNTTPVDNNVYVSRAAPTPVVDADRVVAFYECGTAVAFTHEGKPLWERDLTQETGTFKAVFGLGASPCQNAAYVYVLLEHDGPSALVAINKKNGEIAWKQERTSKQSWSSPALLKIDGVEQVVVSSGGTVDGYNAADGKVLWSIKELGGNTGVTPIDQGNGTFLIGASGGRQGENELAAKKSNGLVTVSQKGGNWHAEVTWANEKLSPSWASPIVHQGLAYWVNRQGVVYCVDATNGELVYSERTKQSCWATPIAVDDRIYLFGKDGLTSVISAGRDFKILAENQLFDPDKLPPETTTPRKEENEQRRQGAAMFSGPTVYGVAVAGDRLVARIGNQVFCIKN